MIPANGWEVWPCPPGRAGYEGRIVLDGELFVTTMPFPDSSSAYGWCLRHRPPHGAEVRKPSTPRARRDVHRSGMTIGQAFSALGGFPCGCALALVCAVYCLAAGPLGWLAGLFVVPLAFYAGALLGAVIIWVAPAMALIWLLNAATGTPQPELFQKIAALFVY